MSSNDSVHPYHYLRKSPFATLKSTTAGSLMVATVTAMTLAGCSRRLPPPLPCTLLSNGEFEKISQFAPANVRARYKALIEAAYTVDKSANELETELIASCQELGRALELDKARITGTHPDMLKQVCGAVGEKLEELTDATPKAKLSIEVEPAKCYADIGNMGECLTRWGAMLSRPQLLDSCKDGEITGKCSGQCLGSCTLPASSECAGECGGRCEGHCDGETYSGDSCAGTCIGKCSGICKTTGPAPCAGSCSGGCDVELEKPQCTGRLEPPNVDSDFLLNCRAKSIAHGHCDPPVVRIAVNEPDAGMQKLVAALRSSLPKIVSIHSGKGKPVAATAKAVAETIHPFVEKPELLSGPSQFYAWDCAESAYSRANNAAFFAEDLVAASATVLTGAQSTAKPD